MLPTLYAEENWVVVDKISRRLGREWQLGDVVVAVSPVDSGKAIAKRILGLSGDQVMVDPRKGGDSVVVPEGHVWLSGDNMGNSSDSRNFGPVPASLLRGRIVARVP